MLPKAFPHKLYEGASFEARVEMLRAATADKPAFFHRRCPKVGYFATSPPNAGRRMAKTLASRSFVDAMRPSES